MLDATRNTHKFNMLRTFHVATEPTITPARTIAVVTNYELSHPHGKMPGCVRRHHSFL